VSGFCAASSANNRLTCQSPRHAGVLQVLATDHAGQPPSLRYLLFTDQGQRYNLLANDKSQWRSGMRLAVKGQQLASSASPGAIGIIPDVLVDYAVSSTAPPGSRFNTAEAGTAGTAPADMSVLFVILTICNQPASITPEVSRDCELGNVSMAYCPQ
jgi:hypothetical protein